MAHWNRPQEGTELRELERESRAAGAPSRGWYAAAFAAGILLVCMLGFSTDLFDSGPTSGDVSKAYREGFDEGTRAAEAFWEDEIDERWWEGYKKGQASDTSMAPVIVNAVREGFSWDAGYQAGLASQDIDVAKRYREGWIEGYRTAWTRVTGESAGARITPLPNGFGYTNLLRWRQGLDGP